MKGPGSFRVTLSPRGRAIVLGVVGLGSAVVIVQRIGYWLTFALRTDLRGPDYFTYYAIARQQLARGSSTVYDLALQTEFQNQVTARWGGSFILLPHLLPPFYTLLYVPLGLLSFRTGYLVLGGLIMVFIAGSVLALLRAADLTGSQATTGSWAALLIAAVALTYLPVFDLLLQEQSDGPVLLGMALAALAWTRGHQGRAGLAATLLLFKPHLLLLVPVLFVTRRAWRALAAFIGGGLAQLLISLPAFGVHGWISYLRLVMPWLTTGQRYWPVQWQAGYGLRGVLLAWIPDPRLELGILLLGYLAVLVALCRRPPEPRLDIGLAIAASVALSPYQHLHDLVLLLVPLFLTMSLLMKDRLRWAWLGWAAVFGAYISVAGIVPSGNLIPPLGVVGLTAYLLAVRLAPASIGHAAVTVAPA